MTPDPKEWNVIVVDMGDTVICDYCNGDYTDLPDEGGLLFGTKAACPECALTLRADAEACDEAHLIGGSCPAGVSFADWVRDELRGPAA